jgi:glycosyltransferase involved in cell wall biosynthesis
MAEELRSEMGSGLSAEHVPLLSVTVLNYNYAHYLPQCLDSILRQTFTDFELLLINDTSTDNSLEVIHPYLADPRVKLINHEHNKGYIASLIEGSDRSRGKYLTVISADDYCVSDRAFEALIGMLEAHPDATWAHSAYGLYDADGTRTTLAQHHTHAYVRPGNEEYRDLLLATVYVSHSGTIIRADSYRAVGGYDPGTRYACDMRMWLTLCGHGSAAYCPEELIAYRQHGSNMSFSAAGVENNLRDHLRAIEVTYPAMRSAPGMTDDLYARGVKRTLSIHAESDIFSGHARAGWYGLWCAFRLHPVWTIFQKRTPILLLRTLVGNRGFQLVYSGVRYLRARAKRQVAFAS